MSAVKLPVTRPAGRALFVGGESCRSEPLNLLGRLGFQCDELEDPYRAMLELVLRPRQHEAIILSLLSLYREELQIIAAIKRRCPQVEIWLTHTDGRAAALAEAMRLGADGLLTEDGLQRLAAPPAESNSPASPISVPRTSWPPDAEQIPTALPHVLSYNELDDANGEPVLSADELRALLQDPA
jgi:hypothetical protein